MSDSAAPWIAACQASLFITNSRSSFTHVHRVGDGIQPSHPLSSLLLLPPIPPSIRVYSNESTLCTGWPKYWSFRFNSSPRTDLFQNGLVKSPCIPRDSQESSPTPKFKSINSSALSFLHSPTLTSYMTTGKTIALTRRTFVGKVMPLLLNMLSRLHYF